MTDTPAPAASTETFGYQGNPWTLALALIGSAVAVLGLILLLIPHVNEFGEAADWDFARLWAGAALTIVGGLALAAWMLLAGLGWQARQRA